MHNSIINATHAVKGPIRSVNIHLHTLWENSRDPLLLYNDITYIINIRLNEPCILNLKYPSILIIKNLVASLYRFKTLLVPK